MTGAPEASAAQLAGLFDCTTKTIDTLTERGVLTRTGTGYNVPGSVRSYVKHLREAAAGRAPTGDLDPSQERARKDAAMALKYEMENEETRGELVRVEDVIRSVEREYSVVRNRLLVIPGKLADRCAMLEQNAVHDLIRTEVNEVLEELSAPADQTEVLPFIKGARPGRTPKTKAPKSRKPA